MTPVERAFGVPVAPHSFAAGIENLGHRLGIGRGQGAQRVTQRLQGASVAKVDVGVPARGEVTDEISLVFPCEPQSMRHLVADMQRRPVEEVRPLANLCFDKTRGNPFFLNQFVQGLFRSGLLRFDGARGRFVWDIAEIEARRERDPLTVVAGDIDESERRRIEEACESRLTSVVEQATSAEAA